MHRLVLLWQFIMTATSLVARNTVPGLDKDIEHEQAGQ